MIKSSKKHKKKEEKNRRFKLFLLITITSSIILTPLSIGAKQNKLKTIESLSQSTKENKQNRYFDKNIESRKSVLYAQNKKTHVFYTNSFLNTDISIKRGEKLKIEASGNIRFGLFAGDGSPEGIPFNPNYNLFYNKPHGSLFARIKESGMADSEGWVFLGKGVEGIVQKSGTLEFIVNDRSPEDNVGNFRIEITISPASTNESIDESIIANLPTLKCDGGQLVDNNTTCVMKLPKDQRFKRVARTRISEGILSYLILELYELKPNKANIAFTFVMDRQLSNVGDSKQRSRFRVVKANIKTDSKIIIDSKYGEFPQGFSPEEESARLIKLHQKDIQMLKSVLTKTP